jgi:hypothetical protein
VVAGGFAPARSTDARLFQPSRPGDPWAAGRFVAVRLDVGFVSCFASCREPAVTDAVGGPALQADAGLKGTGGVL